MRSGLEVLQRLHPGSEITPQHHPGAVTLRNMLSAVEYMPYSGLPSSPEHWGRVGDIAKCRICCDSSKKDTNMNSEWD